MNQTEKYVTELKKVFTHIKDKHEANYQSNQIMVEMSGDDVFFSEILARHLQKPGSLNDLHYPVIGLNIDQNPYFTMVANCWIPLPDRATNISTKSIHHHGDMLLTTATAFGTGYEHWMFEKPQEIDFGKEIYKLKLIEKAPHPRHHIAFVDAYVAHVPMYPPDLTITYALWSSRFPVSWKDKVKRLSAVQKNSKLLKDLAVKAGLSKQLELKIIEYFDFHPTCDGFHGIKDRNEFELTNNEDYLASLFHIIQETGNQDLSKIIREKIDSSEDILSREAVKSYLDKLKKGEYIEGKLSPTHYNIPNANFTVQEINEALAMQDESN